jgi:hypothetical protein
MIRANALIQAALGSSTEVGHGSLRVEWDPRQTG